MKHAITLVLITTLFSCNFRIEKRKYLKGYHIQLSQKKQKYVLKEEQLKSDSIIVVGIKPQKEINKKESNHTVNINSISQKKTNEKKYYNLRTDLFKKTIYKQHITHSYFKRHKTQVQKIKNERKEKNTELYLVAILSGIFSYLVFKKSKISLFKITRWAKKNSLKSKGLIVLAQGSLVISGLALGAELYHSNYIFSNNLEYVFSGIMTLGFLSFFTGKKNNKEFNYKSFKKGKIAHLFIAISLFALSIGVGNKIKEDDKQVSPLGFAVAKIDKNLQASNSKTIYYYTENKFEEPEEEKMINPNYKRGLLALRIIALVFFSIAMIGGIVALSCSLACQGHTGLALLTLFGGGIIAALIMVMLIRWIRSYKYKKPN